MRTILTNMVWLCFTVLLGCTLNACAADPVDVMPPGEWPQGARWCEDERPAHVVVSDALEPDCQGAAAQAVVWWQTQGVDYLTFAIVPDVDLTWSKPMPLFIQVTTDLPEKQAAAGDTRIALVTRDPPCIQAAEIRFDPYWCRGTSNTARHELGHALGLPDLYGDRDRDNLMFWVGTGTNLELTAAQLKQVR